MNNLNPLYLTESKIIDPKKIFNVYFKYYCLYLYSLETDDTEIEVTLFGVASLILPKTVDYNSITYDFDKALKLMSKYDKYYRIALRNKKIVLEAKKQANHATKMYINKNNYRKLTEEKNKKDYRKHNEESFKLFETLWNKNYSNIIIPAFLKIIKSFLNAEGFRCNNISIEINSVEHDPMTSGSKGVLTARSKDLVKYIEQDYRQYKFDICWYDAYTTQKTLHIRKFTEI